jgi:hypothetical protein
VISHFCTDQNPDTAPGLIRSGCTFGLSVMIVPEKIQGPLPASPLCTSSGVYTGSGVLSW